LVEFDRMGNPNCFWGGKIIEGRLVGTELLRTTFSKFYHILD